MKRDRVRLLLLTAIATAGCAPAPALAPTSAPAPDAPGPQAVPAAPVVSVHLEVSPEAAFEAAESAYRLAQAGSRRVVVKVADAAVLDPAIASGLVRLLKVLPTMEAAILEVAEGDVDAALVTLRTLEGVQRAERDGLSLVGAVPRFSWTGPPTSGVVPRPAAPAPWPVTVAPVSAVGSPPNDPRFSSQWAFGPITAVTAWGAAALAAATPPPPMVIAILDTGIDQNHEDIDPLHGTDDQKGKLLRDINFSGSDTVDDKHGHGTHVAGIAAAITNNGVGVAGTYPDAKLMNVKVIEDNGIGYDSAIASGIRWAADHGAQVLSMSFGQTTDSALVRDAVAYAAGKGVLMVGAAGNEGKNIKRYPAAYPSVIAVAATSEPTVGKAEQKASFSNYGAEWVDVAAPGDGIYSTLPNHSNTVGTLHYGRMNGTSMATPMVAAEAAMLWRAYGGDAAKVRARIEGKSDADVSGTGTYWAKGRINCYRALTEP